MDRLDKYQVNQLIELAKETDGRCSHCHQTIAIYHYKVNKQIVRLLKEMSRVVRENDKNEVYAPNLNLPHSIHSQLTKARLHGLIARVKNDDGTKKSGYWLITNKGANFLRGSAIDEVVVVYNNTLLGHEGREVTIHQVSGDVEYGQEPITTEEANVYGDIRKDNGLTLVTAICQMQDSSYYEKNMTYHLNIERIKVGQPIKIVGPSELIYPNIARFQKDWKVTK